MIKITEVLNLVVKKNGETVLYKLRIWISRVIDMHLKQIKR